MADTDLDAPSPLRGQRFYSAFVRQIAEQRPCPRCGSRDLALDLVRPSDPLDVKHVRVLCESCRFNEEADLVPASCNGAATAFLAQANWNAVCDAWSHKG